MDEEEREIEDGEPEIIIIPGEGTTPVGKEEVEAAGDELILLEARRLICPVCGDKWRYYYYKRNDPAIVDCSTCGTQYVWLHETQCLYTLNEPWELQAPEAFMKIDENS